MENCHTCKHLIGWSKEKQSSVCKAFPDGIPLELIYGEVFDHMEHLPGNHGIKYERLTDEDMPPETKIVKK